MTKDVGGWNAEDCALVLIDYQNEPRAKRAGPAHGGH
jgi:hypothetical protein